MFRLIHLSYRRPLFGGGLLDNETASIPRFEPPPGRLSHSRLWRLALARRNREY
jgi:hypothetical protein